MSLKLNLNVYKAAGEPATVKVFEVKEGDDLVIPDGAALLHSEYYHEHDILELWLAVPKSSVLSEGELDTSQKSTGFKMTPEVEDLGEPEEVEAPLDLLTEDAVFIDDDFEEEEIDFYEE